MDNITKKQADIEYALSVVDKIDIRDDWQIANLNDISTEANRVKKELESERQAATKPLNESLRQINGWFKPVIESCDLLRRRANARLLEAKKLREEEREAALGAIAEQGKHITSTAIIPAQAAPVELPRGVGRSVIQIYIHDANAVPREYLTPDEAYIKKLAVKAHKDGKELYIPGVTITVKGSGT